jgi:regulator of sirC expression with transglutaminase-like and TPR domain
MQSQCLVSAAPTPSESRRAALITLLADEDPAVYQAVRQKILSGGNAGNWLQPYALSNDPVLRRRAREILVHLATQEADLHFLGFCLQHGETFDVEQAAWMLGETTFPDSSTDGCRALLDEYAGELRTRLQNVRQPGEILGTINTFLFDELNFRGTTSAGCELDDLCLNRVMERRAGDVVNLCLLYLLLGRRLHLPLAGIAVPGYFLCRYQTSAGEVFIDVRHRGCLLTRGDCLQHLFSTAGTYAADLLEPASARRILLRSCENLHLAYIHRGGEQHAIRIRRYLVALRG